jgi:hypothetical protein
LLRAASGHDSDRKLKHTLPNSGMHRYPAQMRYRRFERLH